MSWGTKQDSTPDTDLGAVIQDSHSQVDVEMLTEAADVNNLYEEALTNLRTRKPAVPKGSGAPPTIAEKEQTAKDYYANVRTNVGRLTSFSWSASGWHIEQLGSLWDFRKLVQSNKKLSRLHPCLYSYNKHCCEFSFL
ncbi:hypothetical protein H0H81_006691 [Sphagnurus paluster]|uniref:Uncharacterized protein n=1 Tax=Sphagnurus paluster TaxID=117069 RepID=A0A9P7G245_9AGAR|nr:hypothetical protein H0H81_006691 [Sphagnurus paluster]